MKSKYITHIIFEGCDGVGKDTLSFEVWKKLNFEYRTYVRGEISDYVYAKKFGRQITTTQNGLPFLHVVLTASEEELKKRINSRDYASEKERKEELAKIKDNQLFLDAAKELSKFYHILVIDVTDRDIEAATNDIIAEVKMYISTMSNDREINDFNKMYELGCKRTGHCFKVRGNQPFIDNSMIMADAHLHNGIYETYDGKSTIEHNLLFSFAYNPHNIRLCSNKDIDFVYPINSKILQRPEVYDYFAAFNKGDKSVLVTDSIYVPKMQNMITMTKTFGDNYIEQLSLAKATIYTSRDLADLKMMTVRVYESILAKQIVFVDKETDKDCTILNRIYKNRSPYADLIISLLYVTPDTIIQNYNRIMNNVILPDEIIRCQNEFYAELVKKEGVNYDIK